MTLEEIKPRFKGVTSIKRDSFQCLCPAHNDKEPSLTVSVGEKQPIILRCHSGCTPNEILEAIGLKEKDVCNNNVKYELTPFEKVKKFYKEKQGLEYIDHYDWKDKSGKYLKTVFRFKKPNQPNKIIRQVQLLDEPIFNVKGVKAEIYNVQVLESNQEIFFCEGEKCVEALNKKGLAAVTTGNCSSWRKHYTHYFKGKDVIILADNDEPGEKFANSVAKDIGGTASSVITLKTSKAKGGDIADYFEEGFTVDDLYKLIEEAKNKQELEQKEKSTDGYLVDYTGKKLKVYENLRVLLDEHNINVKFNELNRKIEVKGKINVQGSYDSIITKLNTLCQLSALKLSKDERYDFMYCIGQDNRYNPVVEYLEQCKDKYLEYIKENNEPIINQLFSTLTYSKSTDAEFNNRVILKALLGAIHLAYNEDSTHFTDFIIVLKGKQGIGKTQWLKNLIPKAHLNEFFKDGVILKLKDKDNIIENMAYWILELGEFSKSLKESDRDELKTFIGKSFDEYRTPYSRTAVKNPRHTYMIATINDDEFLRDATGNRRFVVLEVDKLNFKHSIDIDLLWGELLTLYQSGEYSTFLTEEETAAVLEKNNEYLVRSDEQILLEEYIPFSQSQDQWRPITCSSLVKYIEEESGKKSISVRKIGKALQTMGFNQEYCRVGGVKGRYYILPYILNYSMPI